MGIPLNVEGCVVICLVLRFIHLKDASDAGTYWPDTGQKPESPRNKISWVSGKTT